MLHFKLFGWYVSARIHRARRVTRDELDARQAIVCGSDIEEQYAAQVEHELAIEDARDNLEAVLRDFLSRTRWNAERTDDHILVPHSDLQALADAELALGVERRVAAKRATPGASSSGAAAGRGRE